MGMEDKTPLRKPPFLTPFVEKTLLYAFPSVMLCHAAIFIISTRGHRKGVSLSS